MPLWTRDGQELFYRPVSGLGGARQTLNGIGVSTTPSLTFGTEQQVPIGDFLSFGFYRRFDVMPDCERFLVVLSAEQTGTVQAPRSQLHVVLNWFEELKERIPVP
jgi:hypothetical protein